MSDENEDNDEDGSNYSGDKDDNAAIAADGEDDERHRGQSIYKQQSILQKMAVATMLRRRSGRWGDVRTADGRWQTADDGQWILMMDDGRWTTEDHNYNNTTIKQWMGDEGGRRW